MQYVTQLEIPQCLCCNKDLKQEVFFIKKKIIQMIKQETY